MPLQPIAIVGMGCRFPQANNPQEFWQLLRHGVDTITEVPSERWSLDQYYHPDSTQPHKTNTRWGGFLNNLTDFDPQFFSISPKEARTIDPQQRLLLEVAYEALEDGGQIPECLAGTKTGVFIGIGTHDYSILLWQKPVNEPYATTGTGNCVAANRISYAFDLKGASLAVDTACSSSLVAVHLACQSIWRGESHLALAGGVNVLLSPNLMVGFSKGGFMSPDGRCKSFSADANGYVRGEGAGIILLKPLSQARADGDRIYAVIRATAVNQDGLTNGLPAPNLKAQEEVLRDAYQQAGIFPHQVDYIEAHGTGTKLGDAVELQALGAVIGQNRPQNGYCAIGSVKTNIGHAETAAGIAGLIKTALILHHQAIPPSLHCQQPNSSVDWDGLGLQVQQNFTSREVVVAGVNSFGFGGTNAHIVLESVNSRGVRLTPYQQSEVNSKSIKKDIEADKTNILLLSAKNKSALRELAGKYLDFLQNDKDARLADICHTANTRRTHYNYRLALVGKTREDFCQQLKEFVAGGINCASLQSKNRSIAFLFTGQGSQYVGMARQLYQTAPIFRKNLDRCLKILKSELSESLSSIIYSRNNKQGNRIDETIFTQPALFAVEYSLAQLWLSWGIQPSVLIGHSVGEYVAATLAGVFSLEDGLKLIAARAKLMQQLPSDGTMVAVCATESVVRGCLAGYEGEVSIAAINSPQNIVISGKKTAIDEIITCLLECEIKTTPLKVSHAFHSPLMETIIPEFRRFAAEISYNLPQIPIISNLTGDFITEAIAKPEYWCEHIRQPVNFAASMQKLVSRGHRIFLEVGAKPIILGMAKECLQDKDCAFLPSLRSGVEDWQQIAQSVTQLYLKGVNVDQVNLSAIDHPQVVSLPSYPFQKQRYWLKDLGVNLDAKTPVIHETERQQEHPLLGNILHLAGVEERRFRAKISRDMPIYLQDHCIFDQVVFPATAYLEIFYAAAINIYDDRNFILKDLRIISPLILPENETIELQTIVSKDNQVSLFARIEGESTSFQKQATATIQLQVNNNHKEINLSELITEFDREIDVKSYYAEMRQQGLNYGTYFKNIQTIYTYNNALSNRFRDSQDYQEATGKIKLLETLTKDSDKYHLHPALIDACLQILGATFTEADKRNTFLPVSIDRIQVYKDIKTEIWSYIRIVKSINEIKQVDISLIDNNGTIAATIEGLTLRQIRGRSQEQFSNTINLIDNTTNNNFENWSYELSWQPQPLLLDNSKNIKQSWLILADHHCNLGKELALSLDAQEQDYILAFDAMNYKKIDDQIYNINSTNPEHFQQLLNDIGKIDNIVYLWGLDNKEFNDSEWESSVREVLSNETQRHKGHKVNFFVPRLGFLDNQQQSPCIDILLLIQALQKNKHIEPKLWITTHNSQSITSHFSQIQQAPLWGLAKVIDLEYPKLNCSCIDLDIADLTIDKITEILTQELLFADTEKQIAYHQNTRHVARLKRLTPVDKFQPLQLQISEYGTLDNLTTIPLQRRQPNKGEVEIRVYAAGVNFRDVLNALGMLREVMAEMGFDDAAQIPFGGECAGKITAIGEGVTDLRVGDEVIAACALGSLASFVTVDAKFVAIKPKNLSFIEAATIPTTFLTAYYGLVDRAEIKRDDRILIHSAAGGVGQAAIQIAQNHDAEIFATANKGKWEYIQSLGIEKVMDSRSLDFATEIQELTAGKGVDIVLNSLNGEYIPKSLSVLARNGRFVEIGKLGIWDIEKVRDVYPYSNYFCFDLLEIARKTPDKIQSLLQTLTKEFVAGNYKPLPHRVFPLDRVVDAFRLMAQGKHIGKVVITIPQSGDAKIWGNTETEIETERKSYLISGGFGALGLTVAEWLVTKGARELILVGRNQPSAATKARIAKLEAKGVVIHPVFADISQQEAVKTIIQNHPQLRGVIHGAGILDDGMLINLSKERFDRVLAPKIHGGWNLHHYTQKLPLEFFICFSSIVSLIGSFGQGSYAAANAFLDALARYRQQLGLPALTINWGAWADVGMATQEKAEKWQDLGMIPLQPQAALNILDRLLEEGTINTGIIDVNWDRFLQKTGQTNKNKLFEALISSNKLKIATNKPQSTIIAQLTRAETEDCPIILNEYLRNCLAKVLGFNNSNAIDIDTDFSDLGMDSLMAVELANLLQTNLAINISSNNLFDYPTVEALSGYLFSQLSLDEVREDEEVREDKKAKVDENRDIRNSEDYPPEYYRFELTPEYLNLKRDLEEAKQIGNTFFMPHQGIANATTTIDDREFINYSCYNYLGMSGDRSVIQAARDAIELYGTSVSASRIVSGEIPLHRELETEIADFLQTEDAIVYIGGHPTNVSTIGHLFGDRDLIVCDSLSHNSIRQGCQLSGATVMEFPHNDWVKLAVILEQHRHQYQKTLIAIEGVYSSDGDIAPLPEIIAIKKRYHAVLMVDEAHSIGVLGRTGRGIGEYFNADSKDVDLWMGTLSKSFASCGGYIAGNRAIVEYLKYTSPSFVFSVGMSPANTAAALASLRLLRREPEKVAKLQQNAKLFLDLACGHHFNTGNSKDTSIVPIIIGSRSQALHLSQLMFRRGIYVQPMVYPSVPKNAARLRFFLSCDHTEAQIRETLTILQQEITKLD
jgi:myxalamid-type polyketide synthase MxaB